MTGDSAGNLEQLYDELGGFVWACLYRMGVQRADLEDQLQEVFIVVHRRSASSLRDGQHRSWLYGICANVARNYRRRRRRKPALAAEPLLAGRSPEELAMASESQRRAIAILDELDEDKRTVFVMFEVDGMTCEQIAEAIGAPLGTIYSRLRAARKKLERVLERDRAKGGRFS